MQGDALDVVLVKSFCQEKHTTMHVFPRQKMPPQVLPRQQMSKVTFSQTYMLYTSGPVFSQEKIVAIL